MQEINKGKIEVLLENNITYFFFLQNEYTVFL